ncbi:MAG: NAD(P)H-quinone oxidoreductase [Parvularculaceae bacterium]
MGDIPTGEMRAIEIAEPGGPDVLRLTNRPIPTPGPGEALIKVDAAGVNRPDALQRAGLYPPPPGASDLPGLEVSGCVVALGAPADDAALPHPWPQPGEPVCALLPGGGYAEYAVAPVGSCLPIPAGLSPEEAAGVVETTFTVWANVFDDAGLAAGETLLVHGGSSGVGAAAISLAKAFGARVVATASSEEKLARILEHGADAAHDYTSETWDAEIAEAGGADVVLDMAGGDFVSRNLRLLRPGGRHVSIAFLRGPKAEIDVPLVMRNRLRLSGSTLRARPVEEKARLAAAVRERVWPVIASGAARPAIDEVYPLAEAAAAHARLESGAHFGKIVLAVAGG